MTTTIQMQTVKGNTSDVIYSCFFTDDHLYTDVFMNLNEFEKRQFFYVFFLRLGNMFVTLIPHLVQLFRGHVSLRSHLIFFLV